MGIKHALLSLVLGSVIAACTGCNSSSQTTGGQDTHKEPVINLTSTETAEPPRMITKLYKSETIPDEPATTPQSFRVIGYVDIESVNQFTDNGVVNWQVTDTSMTGDTENSKIIKVSHAGQSLTAKPLGFEPDLNKVRRADMVRVYIVYNPSAASPDEAFFYTRMWLTKNASRS